MHKILIDFLELHNGLHPLQFGFSKKHPTAHALTSLTEKSNKLLMMANWLWYIHLSEKSF